MEYYDINVMKGDNTIAAEKSVALANSRDAWPRIAAIANRFATPGTQIRVTNEAGEIVILVGVAMLATGSRFARDAALGVAAS